MDSQIFLDFHQFLGFTLESASSAHEVPIVHAVHTLPIVMGGGHTPTPPEIWLVQCGLSSLFFDSWLPLKSINQPQLFPCKMWFGAKTSSGNL